MSNNNPLTEEIKKVFLAGIGAIATTTEKSEEILKDLVEKGELTVDQGKGLNEELKHKAKEKLKLTPEQRVDTILGKLSEEELEMLKKKLDEEPAEE